MAIYALDIYGKGIYGGQLYVAFDASPMVAEQRAQGVLNVTWSTPYQASASAQLSGVKGWTRLRLVRNAFGPPDTEDDGWVILDVAAGTGGGAGQPANAFADDTVVPGRMYYYAVYVASTVDVYSATAVYQVGDYVSYSGINYRCLAPNTVNVTPGTNAAVWAVTSLTTPWYRAAYCVGLAVRDWSHSQLLYDLIPRPYKIDAVETTATSIPVNDQLRRFLDIFGFGFDIIKTENAQLTYLNDPLRCSDRQLGLIAEQMGVADYLPGLPELRREYIKDAALIQRDRGTAESMARLVKAMAGWDSTVTIGYNLLHDADEASWASPAYAAWSANSYYVTNIQAPSQGDIVSYAGSLYRAMSGMVQYGALLQNSSSAPALTGTVTKVTVTDPLADPLTGYVRFTGGAVGNTATWTFSAPATGAGTYTVYLGLVGDPAGGILTASVNGTASTVGQIDTYLPSRASLGLINLGTFTLTATGNTLQLAVAGQNAMSAGQDMVHTYWAVQSSTVASNVGIPPTGDSRSATYWQAITPASVKDVDTERTMLTDGYSSWSMVNSQGAENVRPTDPALTTAQWWVSPQGASVGTASPGSGNSLVYTVLSTLPSGTVDVHTVSQVQSPTWSASTLYLAGQPVIYNPLGLSVPPVYVARAATMGDEPDISPNRWMLTSIRDRTQNDPYLVQSQALPLPRTQSWSSMRAYAPGDQVSWRGQLYEAALPSSGIFPSGYSMDSLWWRWCGLDTQSYTFSVYHNRTATAAGRQVRPYITWYDPYGALLGTAQVPTTAQLVYDRFEIANTVYPQQTTAPAGWTTPAAYQQGVAIPWVAAGGDWSTTRGMVYPTSWNSVTAPTTTTLEMQAGRIVWFNRTWITATPTGSMDQIYVTFRSAPSDPSNTMEHGIAFRYGNNAYWLASRTQLTYTTLTYTSGSLTGVSVSHVASWSALADGTRMRVTVTDTTVTVDAMTGSSPGMWTNLATVSDTRNNTQAGYGLLERIQQ